MKSKYLLILFLCTSFLCSSVLITKASAYTITLDGVDNAIDSTMIYSSSYLTIVDKNNINHTYDGTNIEWEDYSDLLDDISDGSTDSGLDVTSYTLLSGGNVFGDSYDAAIYKTLSLVAGTYTITLSSGMYNLLGGADDYWNAYVQIFGEGVSINFGDGTTFSTEQDALNYFSNYYITLTLLDTTDLYFYINDWNSIDNIGSVTLDIEAAPVPEPATLLLFGSGIAALAARRGYRKKGVSKSDK